MHKYESKSKYDKYILISIGVAFTYINNVRPVGWFDSVFAIFIGILVFFILKKIRGIRLK